MSTISQETIEIFKILNDRENKFFKGKKILLLGSDGSLGKYFVEYFFYLLKKDIKLHLDCVDNNISSKQFSYKKNKFIKFYKSDDDF